MTNKHMIGSLILRKTQNKTKCDFVLHATDWLLNKTTKRLVTTSGGENLQKYLYPEIIQNTMCILIA